MQVASPTSRLEPKVEASDIYEFNGIWVNHELRVGSLQIKARVPQLGLDEDDPKSAWYKAYLHGIRPRSLAAREGRLQAVDLFCGAGGLALGFRQVADELGALSVTRVAVDHDAPALGVYERNHDVEYPLLGSVTDLVDFAVRRTPYGALFQYHPEIIHEGAAPFLQGIDVVLAGPPCQGHSNLNNHTRRADPRNDLYLYPAAVAVAVGAKHCIIENVPSVVHDSSQVVQLAQTLLDSAGYRVTHGILNAAELGWPQARKRHFLVASRESAPLDLGDVLEALRDVPRSVTWAIGDLVDIDRSDPMDRLPDLSKENLERISWLFENEAYDLDLSVRPQSHRNGTSYQSVYGRMRPDEPAPTITTGFGTPGRGRFVHPTRRSVLTAREAARLQGFPDTYKFVDVDGLAPSRALLAKWIGDAVPMPLGYAAIVSALGGES